MTSPPLTLATAHHRRLREIWRSAGWPCQDTVEIELLAAGLLERLRDGHGRETLRVTDAGLQALATRLTRNRAARSAHEALVERVAGALCAAGRITWRGLSLRARITHPPDETGTSATAWVMAMPDVYSVRHTSVPGYLQSAVHEIKVRRADLLADLRHTAKRAAYLDMASECWYVLAEGIAEPDEVPRECGVLLAPHDPAAPLALLRPAPHRPMPGDTGLPFGVWMALARATPVAAPDHPQRCLGDTGDERLDSGDAVDV